MTNPTNSYLTHRPLSLGTLPVTASHPLVRLYRIKQRMSLEYLAVQGLAPASGSSFGARPLAVSRREVDHYTPQVWLVDGLLYATREEPLP